MYGPTIRSALEEDAIFPRADWKYSDPSGKHLTGPKIIISMFKNSASRYARLGPILQPLGTYLEEIYFHRSYQLLYFSVPILCHFSRHSPSRPVNH